MLKLFHNHDDGTGRNAVDDLIELITTLTELSKNKLGGGVCPSYQYILTF